MPRTDDTYPDRYMKAIHVDEWLADGEEEHVVMTIKSTDLTEYSDGKKQILLRFRETHLELGLNKGNAMALAEIFNSNESDDWIGKKVAMHTERVKNNMVPGGSSKAIRVSDKQTIKANRPATTRPAPAANSSATPSAPARKPAPMTQQEVDDDDAIPEEVPF